MKTRICFLQLALVFLMLSGVGYAQDADPTEMTTRVIRLEHAVATDIANAIQGIYNVRTAVDNASNSIILRSDEKTLTETEELIRVLDVEPKKPAPSTDPFSQLGSGGVNPAAGLAYGGGLGGWNAPTGRIGFGNVGGYYAATPHWDYSGAVSFSPEGQALATEISNLEQQTMSIVQDFRSRPLESEERERMIANVQKLTEQEFDKRLQLQELEVKQLQDRLAKVQKALARRQELKDKIVEKRVNELLANDELDWNPGTPRSETSLSAPVQYPSTTPVAPRP